ncbi:MAG: serine/threonine-protein phosphatase [Gammaproteobacteria bacterium]|nr:serine/threonine-protein phosphatase [Gammaproteobacteria bacterium]
MSAQESAAPALTWTSATLSHVGNVRRLNEDSCLDRPDIGLWVVADGMGGHAAGDLASQLVVNMLDSLRAPESLNGFIDAVEDALLKANARLIKMATDTNQTSGSTVVALLAFGRHAAYIWAGDSRLYRLRQGQLRQLSTDHSQIELYIEKGLLTREEAAGHPAANMVTRAVGGSPDLHLDVDVTDIEPGDRYVLCSDGLDKHVRDADIAELLARGTVGDAARALIDTTLERGATDNVTVAVIEISERDGVPPAAQRGASALG